MELSGPLISDLFEPQKNAKLLAKEMTNPLALRSN